MSTIPSPVRLIPLVLLAAVGACHHGGIDPAPVLAAHAALHAADGADLGTVELRQDVRSSLLSLHFRVHGLAAGQHGVHLHTVGACDASTATPFASAGAHFNPGGTMQHGLENPAGPHAGDLPNLVVGSDGTADVTLTTTRAGIGTTASTLLDADGGAVVVHAAADDQRTDPSGNSGARVGCGVVIRDSGV